MTNGNFAIIPFNTMVEIAYSGSWAEAAEAAKEGDYQTALTMLYRSRQQVNQAAITGGVKIKLGRNTIGNMTIWEFGSKKVTVF